jgi:hypothetical protein
MKFWGLIIYAWQLSFQPDYALRSGSYGFSKF